MQVSKLSFESHPPRVRKRARVKRSTAAGGSRGRWTRVEGEESEVKGRGTRGRGERGEGRAGELNGGREDGGGAKGNYPKTRYLDWTPWGARR